jgi:cytochrome c553
MRRLARCVATAACLLASGLGGAVLAAGDGQRPMPVQVPDTLAQRLAPCTACHGVEGRSVGGAYVPRIAGKPAGYLFEQLLNFRDARRHNATMAGLLDGLPEPYLREIAQHFSALDFPHDAPAAGTVLSRGEALARRGDAAREVPACADCHGSQLTGALPSMPGLLGLPRDYVIAQLGAWRTGARHAVAPDCMSEVARRLSPEDLLAVATWLSAQPVPQPMRPAPPPDRQSPLRCGSAGHPR